jgi:hypothetical protein
MQTVKFYTLSLVAGPKQFYNAENYQTVLVLPLFPIADENMVK